jgi:hypothetical protein
MGQGHNAPVHMSQKSSFKNAERQQLSILTPLEKKTLKRLAERMPAWVNSDHLTLRPRYAFYVDHINEERLT